MLWTRQYPIQVLSSSFTSSSLSSWSPGSNHAEFRSLQKIASDPTYLSNIYLLNFHSDYPRAAVQPLNMTNCAKRNDLLRVNVLHLGQRFRCK